MRRNRIPERSLLLAVVLVMVGIVVFGVGQAKAVNWIANDADPWDGTTWLLWNDANNWDANVPVDGEEARFNNNGKMHVDLNGTAVNLPTSTMFIRDVDGMVVDDTSTSDYSLKAPLNLDIFHIQQYSRPRTQIHVPINAATEIRSRYRLGGVDFYNTLNTPEIDLGRGDIYIYGDANATTIFKVVKDDNATNAYLRQNPETGAYPTLTTPLIYMEDSSSTFRADSNVVTATIEITNAARYFANTDGSMGDAGTNVTLSNGGFLQIGAAQSSLASIDVQNAFCVLAGDLTGATYGVGGNVSLVEDAVLAPTGGAEPTRAELGGAILYQGLTSTNKTVTVGDNGTDSIYKGAAIGAFSPDRNISITAVENSGDLQVVIAGAGNPDMYNTLKFYGDGNSTTADIAVINGARLRLKGSFNSDYDYTSGGEPNRIDTFNIFGEVSKESTLILDHYRGNATHVKEGQTWNISAGTWNPSDNFAGRGQHGHVNVTDAVMGQTTTAYNSNDSGFSLNLAGKVVVRAEGASNHGNFEALDANFTYAGAHTVLTLTNGQNYNIDYRTDATGANPVFAGLWLQSDISNGGANPIDFDGNMVLGHEKYYYNAMFQNWDDEGPMSTTGKIMTAGNQPGGVKPVIGLAAAVDGDDMKVQMEIDNPGGIVRCGTTDPDRILTANTGAFVTAIPGGEVALSKNVTADEIEIQSGGLRLDSGVQLNTGSAATPFDISMDTVTSSRDLIINSSDIDTNNAVIINGNAGDRIQIGSNVSLTDTTIIANAGLNQVYVGGNTSTVTLKNLEMNTEVYYGSNNGTGHLEITGTLSGTGNFASNNGNNSCTILTNATIAPGANGGDNVGELNNADNNRKILLEDGATYEWQIADPAGEAGTGWDIFWAQTIDFAVTDPNASTLYITVDGSGLSGDIVGTDLFAIMAADNFDEPDVLWDVVITSGELDVSGASLVYDDTLDVDNDGNNDKAYYLTGIVSGVSADTNGDGVVDATDYIALKRNLGTGSGAGLADGDLDGDGDVDWDDLTAMNTALNAAAGANTIPEPATMGLLAIGALALVRRRRK